MTETAAGSSTETAPAPPAEAPPAPHAASEPDATTGDLGSPGPSRRSYAILLLLAVVFGAAVRAFFSAGNDIVSADETAYLTSGLNLWSGHGFTTLSGAAETHFPPGLPFVLGGLHEILGGDPHHAWTIVTLLTTTLVILPIAGITRLVAGRRGGALAAWLAAIVPALVVVPALLRRLVRPVHALPRHRTVARPPLIDLEHAARAPRGRRIGPARRVRVPHPARRLLLRRSSSYRCSCCLHWAAGAASDAPTRRNGDTRSVSPRRSCSCSSSSSRRTPATCTTRRGNGS